VFHWPQSAYSYMISGSAFPPKRSARSPLNMNTYVAWKTNGFGFSCYELCCLWSHTSCKVIWLHYSWTGQVFVRYTYRICHCSHIFRGHLGSASLVYHMAESPILASPQTTRLPMAQLKTLLPLAGTWHLILKRLN